MDKYELAELIHSKDCKSDWSIMTYYKRYSEQQRNDPELRALIKKELELQRKFIERALEQLKLAHKALSIASNIEEDVNDQSTGLIEARRNVTAAIMKFEYRIENPATETYIGNVAAGMTQEQIEQLKEKYAENLTD